jgi:iterative type I PKS product template protein
MQGQSYKVTTETNIARPDLEETFKGHIVNGSPLCSSAVYTDMALTIGDYVHRQLEPDNDKFAMNCSNMVVDKPLIGNGGDTPQLLRTYSKADLSHALCDITFYSVTAEGQKTVEHAHCQIQYGDANKWSRDLSRQKYLIQSQLDRLLQVGQKGDFNKLRRNMAYKPFSVLVDYQDAYKGMAEVVLDSPNREGTARIELPTIQEGSFFIAPYHIDSLCHLAGFIMNANDELDSSKTVFVNHGWESLRFAEKPQPNKTYYSYVRMQPTGPNSKDYSGDVYVFDNDGNVIGQIGGLEFQFLPKQVLDRVLPSVGGAKASSGAPATTTAPVPKKAVSKTTPMPQPKAASSGTTTSALEIMAEEIGVAVVKLTDTSELTPLGVDSLMSLSISGNFREKLELEVPSTLFVDCQTIKEVKGFLAQHESADSQPPLEIDPSSAESSDVSGFSTPCATDVDSMSSISSIDETESTKDADNVSIIRAAISEETGVPVSEVTSATELATMGIDSLMSLQILGILREESGLNLPATFFTDHQTFGDIARALVGNKKQDLPVHSEDLSTDQVVTKLTKQTTPPAKTRSPSPVAPPQIKSAGNVGAKLPRATSVLLQGSMKTSSQTLFLFPDGSGSATSYATISPIAPKEVALVGLSCPFMKTPAAFNCGIEGVTALYLAEIRRRQPHGPYILGGWSAGGICAYEACLQLQAVGEVVEKLIFLDVPYPPPPQALPSRLHHFFDSIGLLGAEGEAPEWLLPHFEASIRALSAYRPKAMDASQVRIPKTFTIYAQDGVCKRDSDPRPELAPEDPPHMSWLLFNRTDFGPMGWENLRCGEKDIISLDSIADVNHFTIMREPRVREIPSRIRQALEVKGRFMKVRLFDSKEQSSKGKAK